MTYYILAYLLIGLVKAIRALNNLDDADEVPPVLIGMVGLIIIVIWPLDIVIYGITLLGKIFAKIHDWKKRK